ncbi:MAG: fused MFS/spermidine synthase [Deltaproteobacteria bacterium]|nr:fused MFS/spermidine synthase [Deltaproteobacteria bacterium]
MQKVSASTMALLLFVSGASGLVYEVVWLRMLVRAFGVTIHAVSTVLFVFMLGLALGSFFAARRVGEARQLLRGYAYAELAIGILALLSTPLIGALPDLVSGWLSAGGTEPVRDSVVRLLVATPVLLPTTFAMGTTLPFIGGYLSARFGGAGRQVGLLYGANTLGAVTGTIASGFFGLMILGERGTVLAAAIGNLVVGVVAIAISRRAPAETAAVPAAPEAAPLADASGAGRLLAISALSGFAALACQLVWSRLLTFILGNSVYGFSAMLSVYLLGIGGGSMLMSRTADRLVRPRTVLAVLMAAAAILSILSVYVFRGLGESMSDPLYAYSQLWSAGDFARLWWHAVLVVLPLTLVLGAIFPVLVRLSVSRAETANEMVGRLYGWNTVGAIAGSLLPGFLLVPLIGTMNTLFLVSLDWLILAGLVWRDAVRSEAASQGRAAPLAVALVWVVVLSGAFEDPMLRLTAHRIAGNERVVAHRDDREAVLTAVEVAPESSGGKPSFDLYINGIIVSSTSDRLGWLMISMPTAFHPDPKRVLIIGLGVGEALRAAVDYRLDATVVDLVPAIRDLFSVFHPDDFGPYLASPYAHLVFEDGRNFLLKTREKFDYLLVDGTPPIFASGTVNLLTKEFFALVSAHLTEDGIFAMWFPTNTFESDLWMVMRNFAETFPQIQAWSEPGLTGIILLGSKSAQPVFELPAEELDRRLKARDLRQRFTFADGARLVRGFPLTPALLRSEASRYPSLTDDNPITEFPLMRFLQNEPLHKDSLYFFRRASELRAGAQR